MMTKLLNTENFFEEYQNLNSYEKYEFLHELANDIAELSNAVTSLVKLKSKYFTHEERERWNQYSLFGFDEQNNELIIAYEKFHENDFSNSTKT